MEPEPKLKAVMIGGGGHARVLIDAIQCSGAFVLAAVLDRSPALHGTEIYGVPVPGDESLLDELIRQGVSGLVIGVGSVGSPRARQAVHALGISKGLAILSVIHPAAVISRHARLEEGAQVFARAVINPGASLGANVIVNTGAIVEHNCAVGDFCHVSVGAVLCGAARVGAGTHIGAGATVRQGITIGSNVMVGAGAVVVNDIPDDWVVAGVPARPISKKQL